MTLWNGATRMLTLNAILSPVVPGIFTANASGQGPAAAQAMCVQPDGSQTVESVTNGIDLRSGAVYLLLCATGLRHRSSLDGVVCNISGRSLPVVYAGPQSEFPGLDQVNVLLPASLAGAGTVNVSLSVDGVISNTAKLLFP